MRLRVRSERGFSLVETLSALVVFSLVTLGIVPVLLTSIRGTNIARSFTQGKNVGLEAMERVRGVPFHIDYGTQPSRVDVLDLYFPNLTAFNTGTCTGYFTASTTCTSTGHVAGKTPGYLTTCPAAGVPACPAGIPAGHSITYQASFIQDENPPLTTAGDEETYDRVPPTAGYRYDLVGSDQPPKLLVEMTITVRWTLEGRARSYELKTLLGDRQFGDFKLKASARVDHVINVVAGYSSQGIDPISELTAVTGFSESKIESRRLSTADNTTRSVQFRLVDAEALPGCPPSPCPGEDLATPESGAESVVVAPPDTSAPDVNVIDIAFSHPNPGTFGKVAEADDTSTLNVSAAVASAVPVARGEFRFSPGSSILDLGVLNKRGSQSDIGLAGDEVLEVRKLPAGTNSILGNTLTQANAVGSGVNATAHAEFGDLQLFPVNFIPSAEGVVVIENFTATVDCDATTTGTADAPDVSYSATLKYWFDPVENDVLDGGYLQVTLTLDGSDPLPGIKSANPLVWDRNPDTKDVYLFPKTSPARDGYLNDWSSLTTATTSVGDSGRIVTGNLEGAISIETGGVEKSGSTVDPDTNLGISIGVLSCSAEDRR